MDEDDSRFMDFVLDKLLEKTNPSRETNMGTDYYFICPANIVWLFSLIMSVLLLPKAQPSLSWFHC